MKNATTLPPEYASCLAAIRETPLRDKVTMMHLGERTQGIVRALVDLGLVEIVNGNPCAVEK